MAFTGGGDSSGGTSTSSVTAGSTTGSTTTEPTTTTASTSQGSSIQEVQNAINDIVHPEPGSNAERATTTIATTVPPGNVARTSNQFRSSIANFTTGLAPIIYPPHTPNITMAHPIVVRKVPIIVQKPVKVIVVPPVPVPQIPVCTRVIKTTCCDGKDYCPWNW